MKVSVDRDGCVSAGACVRECPEVFAQDDEGIVVLKIEQPPLELARAVRNAEDACPAAVIEVED